MSPNELMVLWQVLEAGQLNKHSLSRRMDIATDYADYALRSLSQKGHLRPATPVRPSHFAAYELTPKGAEELLNNLEFIMNREAAVAERAMHSAQRVDQRTQECKALVRERFPEPLMPVGVD